MDKVIDNINALEQYYASSCLPHKSNQHILKSAQVHTAPKPEFKCLVLFWEELNQYWPAGATILIGYTPWEMGHKMQYLGEY